MTRALKMSQLLVLEGGTVKLANPFAQGTRNRPATQPPTVNDSNETKRRALESLQELTQSSLERVEVNYLVQGTKQPTLLIPKQAPWRILP